MASGLFFTTFIAVLISTGGGDTEQKNSESVTQVKLLIFLFSHIPLQFALKFPILDE